MSEQFDVVDLIRAKRDRRTLQVTEIDWLIDAYTRGFIAEEQMSALAMAILLNGMSRTEIAHWTQAMINSGERMDFSSLRNSSGGRRRTADKHSTGGVGDKITLPLAPLVASFGVPVPQLSGRGLGHTGGTLDKLESIPGWRASLSNEEIMTQLDEVSAVICAAGSGLAPADKKLYALRDVTGTVESIPMIAASIMSKKIAEGTDVLVLDVKVGSGAFMKTLEDAKELASTMVALGQDAGVNTSALVTAMDTPLGLTVGNAIEVEESVEVLAGGGPSDVVDLTVELAQQMLTGVGLHDVDPRENLRNGRAMDSWRQMIRAQSGDPDAPLAQPQYSHTITAETSGVVQRLEAYGVGIAAWRLGAGRSRREDRIFASAGVRLHVREGDLVRAGQPLATLGTDDEDRLPRGIEACAEALTLTAGSRDYPESTSAAESAERSAPDVIRARILPADL